MNALSPREHARLAAELIAACGGLSEAVRACRVGKSTLSTYQSPHEAATMPADVMADLEGYCGRAVYSAALADLHTTPQQVGDLQSLACDLSETTLDVQGIIRRSLADGKVSPRELDAIAAAERDAEVALERLKGARRAIEAASPHSRLRVA